MSARATTILDSDLSSTGLSGMMYNLNRSVGFRRDCAPGLGHPINRAVIVLGDAMRRHERVDDHHVDIILTNGRGDVLDHEGEDLRAVAGLFGEDDRRDLARVNE